VQGIQSLKMIAAIWGVSEEAVRQLENRAYLKFIKRFAIKVPQFFSDKQLSMIQGLNLNQRNLKIHLRGGPRI
jgi:hypothetical protein